MNETMDDRQQRLGVNPDEDFFVWRYLDFQKFEWMIREQKLYLRRVDLFNDSHEGALSRKTIDLMGMTDIADPIMREMMQQHVESNTYRTYASCWHESDHESGALWAIYGDENSICVQSRYRKLRAVLPEVTRNEISSGAGDLQFDELRNCTAIPHVDIGRVRYVDYLKDVVSNDYLWGPILHKRKEFEFEKELRVFTCADLGVEIDFLNEHRLNGVRTSAELSELGKQLYPDHVEISIDLRGLLESVILKPSASDEFALEIQDILSASSLSRSLVKQSSMSVAPPRI